eukprot:4486981-Lingulodinium_polyedra.AAC.1
MENETCRTRPRYIEAMTTCTENTSMNHVKHVQDTLKAWQLAYVHNLLVAGPLGAARASASPWPQQPAETPWLRLGGAAWGSSLSLQNCVLSNTPSNDQQENSNHHWRARNMQMASD